MNTDDQFYKGKRWITLRDSVMRSDKYMCQLSKRYGKYKPAEVVHHIFPRLEYPEYQYERWNLISITIAEHNKLHDRNTNELTDYGVELLRRTALRNNIPIPEKYIHGQKKVNHHERRNKY